MLCLEVSVNGERLCVAGQMEVGSITAAISWHLAPPDGDSSAPVEQWKDKVGLHITGSARDQKFRWEHRKWAEIFAEDPELGLQVEDVVTIKIVELPNADKPVRAWHPNDAQWQQELRRKYYEELKQEFEGT